jgi:uncharacterized RmlC-like cupin family protein
MSESSSAEDAGLAAPQLDQRAAAVRHVALERAAVDPAVQSGIRRLTAISGVTVGAENLWMGEAHLPPASTSGDHHHGPSETAVYVVSGHPVFVYPDSTGGEPREVRITAGPGEYVFVPAWLPHREENPDPDHPAVVVLARSTQEAIVVTLPSLT